MYAIRSYYGGLVKENFKSIYIAISLLMLIVITGTSGYMLIEGFSFTNAFFMTIITISTVGFREVQPLV